jgi:hypothetical protein
MLVRVLLVAVVLELFLANGLLDFFRRRALQCVPDGDRPSQRTRAFVPGGWLLLLWIAAVSKAGRQLYSSSLPTTSRLSHTSGSSAARTAARSVSFLRIRSAIAGL